MGRPITSNKFQPYLVHHRFIGGPNVSPVKGGGTSNLHPERLVNDTKLHPLLRLQTLKFQTKIK